MRFFLYQPIVQCELSLKFYLMLVLNYFVICSGLFGLWLDGDLNHGRSHSCKTFDNETLSSKEDFICRGLEAWSFE